MERYTVTITVTGVNEAPEITAEDFEYAENGTDDVNPGEAAFSAMDPENAGTVALDLSGTDASLFNFNTNTGVLSFKDSPNYESPGDANGDNTYELTVGARDTDGIRSTKDIEVKVTQRERGRDGDAVCGPASCWSPGDGQADRHRRSGIRRHLAVERRDRQRRLPRRHVGHLHTGRRQHRRYAHGHGDLHRSPGFGKDGIWRVLPGRWRRTPGTSRRCSTTRTL